MHYSYRMLLALYVRGYGWGALSAVASVPPGFRRTALPSELSPSQINSLDKAADGYQ